MLLYSKLELTDSKVKFIVENNIPSINTKLILKSGATVMSYGIHPTPPSPIENERSAEGDKELLLIADIVKEQDKPVIVIGDLNDELEVIPQVFLFFMSELLDPRSSRVFFNSFHTPYPFLHFLSDHAFISPDFKLNKKNHLTKKAPKMGAKNIMNTSLLIKAQLRA